ncbi:O-antigen ligase family protein [Paraclostridium sordellii]|uniref:O-antigen ligase family protein n=1 Tax=Paraclostridium sordellii TaxID=1505 RepID=UPI0005E8575D|nr:O-antigen ligase family protein [Paeniclostridium sordellii]CEQ18542.1 Phosphoglycerol transferase and related proteins [[Clostridium] sordellii] [Paeniclostridium sordellii]
MIDKFNNKFIIFFILLHPILDIITSYSIRAHDSSISIGIFIKSLFMIYIVFLTLFRFESDKKFIKQTKLIMIGILIYMCIFLINDIVYKPTHIIKDIIGMVKLFYFPIILCGLCIINERDKIKISTHTLIYVLIIYAAIIFIATITGTYFRSYEKYYIPGSVGWFYAANEIGAIIAILTPFTMIFFIKNKLKINSLIMMTLVLFAVTYMGTKVPFLAFIIYLTTIMTIILKERKLNKYKFKKRIVHITLMIFLFVICSYKSPIYMNIKSAYEKKIEKNFNNKKYYGENSKIDRKNNNIIILEGNRKIDIRKYNNNLKADSTISKLMSRRNLFAYIIKHRFEVGTLKEKMIGLGYYVDIEPEVLTSKTIEIDFLDILYRQGIIGFILYFLQFILILKIIFNYIKEKNKSLWDLNIIGYILSIVVGLLISICAGHVFTAPSVSIYIALVIILFFNSIREKV